MTPARRLATLDRALRETLGQVHSIETCGTVDGPGIRTVVFLQGCLLTCRYCHNPDAWERGGGRPVRAEDLARELLAYRPYHQASGGGVTLSGGDPLAQPAFSSAILLLLRELGIHSALDTSGGRPLRTAAPILEAADLVMLDLKHTDPERHHWLTGVPLTHPLASAGHCAAIGKPVWLRHVVIPGITDGEDHLHRLGELIAQWPNVLRVDLLPYHTMHLHKWAQLDMANPLEGVPAATEAMMVRARAILRDHRAPLAAA
jgi:pyruvate formate lyase activating enzyme